MNDRCYTSMVHPMENGCIDYTETSAFDTTEMGGTNI